MNINNTTRLLMGANLIIKQTNFITMTDQFKLNELLGYSLAKHLTQTTKKNLVITKTSDLEKYEHWDAIIYSAITNHVLHPMVVELKSIYSSAYFEDGIIKKVKFDGLMKLIETDKAKRLGTKCYMINIHPNHCNIIDLNAIQKAINEEDNDVVLIKKWELKYTAIQNEEYTWNYYYQFNLNKFSELVEFTADYSKHRNDALELAKKVIEKNIKWEDGR